jgi:hypothetical protein
MGGGFKMVKLNEEAKRIICEFGPALIAAA